MHKETGEVWPLSEPPAYTLKNQSIRMMFCHIGNISEKTKVTEEIQGEILELKRRDLK